MKKISPVGKTKFMKPIICIVLLFLWGNGMAQEGSKPLRILKGNHLHHDFEEGTVTQLIADRVNIRQGPSTKAVVAVNLPIGTPITIVEQTTEQLLLNGFKAPWYKVSFPAIHGVSDGYVWGGLIALGQLPCATDPEVVFLYGVKEVIQEAGRSKLIIQVRACKDYKELSATQVTSIGTWEDAPHQWISYDNRGMLGVSAVLEYVESSEQDAFVNETTTFFWYEQQLQKVITLRNVSDSRAFDLEKMTYPNEPGGLSGARLVREDKEGRFDEMGKEIIEKHTQIIYVWTGELEDLSSPFLEQN